MRCLILASLLALGCGEGIDTTLFPGGKAPVSQMREGGEPMGESGTGTELPGADAIPRKIIYTATARLIVEEFDDIPSRVETLTMEYGGYVARSELTGSPGAPRSGRWTLRAPVGRYEKFLDAILKLGEARSVSTDSQDVSEEYYDVQARIRTKKQEEERLLQLLEDATGKLEDVLAVEKELARVRGEIEQIEGRLRVLNDLTAMTTVELFVDEIKDYVPEAAASFPTRIRRAFNSSISGLVSAGKNLLLVGVVLTPWLVVLAVLLFPPLLVLRWRRRKRQR